MKPVFHRTKFQGSWDRECDSVLSTVCFNRSSTVHSCGALSIYKSGSYPVSHCIRKAAGGLLLTSFTDQGTGGSKHNRELPGWPPGDVSAVWAHASARHPAPKCQDANLRQEGLEQTKKNVNYIIDNRLRNIHSQQVVLRGNRNKRVWQMPLPKMWEGDIPVGMWEAISCTLNHM